MPFEVTATRKRPQSFEQLAGQNFVAATLISSLEQGRIAHAYLFSGPRGCGKTSTARILAKALNCEHGPTPHPCGTCPSCLAISKGSSLDVIEIDGASNTSVDNIRQIKDEVLFAPNSGRYKIYIIDEVHMLSMNAFNALLKTIEEPPPYIVFIFATTEPHKVPATIKSRCQQFNFRLVPVETIVELLRQAAAESDIHAEEEALLWIAREAAGSVRDAYTLFDQIASFSGKEITAQSIRDTLGLVGIDHLNELFRAIVSGETKTAFGVLDEILERGVSPEQFLTDAVDYCRSLLLISHGVQKESLLCAPRTVFDPSVLAALSKVQLEYAIALLLDSYRHLKDTIEPRYELELAVAKLCHIKAYISPLELIDALHSVQKALNVKETAPQTAAREKGFPPPFQVQRNNSAKVAVSSPEPEPPPAASSELSRIQSIATKPSKPVVGTESVLPSADSLSTSELRKKIIAKLRNQNLFLASALEKSLEWAPKPNGFIIPVMNRVEMDLISRFASLISSTGAQLLGGPCAIEARFIKDQNELDLFLSSRKKQEHSAALATESHDSAESSPSVSDSHAAASDHGSSATLNDSVQNPARHSDTGRSDSEEPPVFTAEAESESSDEFENPPTEGTSPSAPPHGAQKLTETDEHTVELIRKMFKGKIIATKPASHAAPSPGSPVSSPSQPSDASPEELPENTEGFADTADTDEDEFD